MHGRGEVLKLLPARQKWDQRYATFDLQTRSQPTPFVKRCLLQLPGKGRALDLAAGAGRHTLALAQHGLQVDAIDISCRGLRLARQRVLEAQISERVQFIVADIERTWLPHRQYEVILVSFFLHRPLLSLIKKRLIPGGWLIYQTFTVEQMAAPGRHCPSRREFLLEHSELKEAFADFDTLFYNEGDYNGRATAQLLARKPVIG